MDSIPREAAAFGVQQQPPFIRVGLSCRELQDAGKRASVDARRGTSGELDPAQLERQKLAEVERAAWIICRQTVDQDERVVGGAASDIRRGLTPNPSPSTDCHAGEIAHHGHKRRRLSFFDRFGFDDPRAHTRYRSRGRDVRSRARNLDCLLKLQHRILAGHAVLCRERTIRNELQVQLRRSRNDHTNGLIEVIVRVLHGNGVNPGTQTGDVELTGPSTRDSASSVKAGQCDFGARHDLAL